MDRRSVEEIIKEHGFTSYEVEDIEDCLVFGKECYDDCTVLVNGVGLYVRNENYVRFEVDKWGLCIRLYYECYYVGSIVNSWEDIQEFEIQEE